MPVLFFYTSTKTGAMIREVLGMQDPKGPYYDPAGKGTYGVYENVCTCVKHLLDYSYILIIFHFCHKHTYAKKVSKFLTN